MAVVIHSAENGVFLGTCLGLGFWSRFDAINLDHAPTFDTAEAAREFMGSFPGEWPVDLTFVTAESDDDGYASMESCTRAGIAPWLTAESESAHLINVEKVIDR